MLMKSATWTKPNGRKAAAGKAAKQASAVAGSAKRQAEANRRRTK